MDTAQPTTQPSQPAAQPSTPPSPTPPSGSPGGAQAASGIPGAPGVPKKPFSKKMLLIIGGVVIFLFVVILGFAMSGSSNKPSDHTQTNGDVKPTEGIEEVKKKTQETPTAKAASHVMIYGAWTGQTSVIKSVDLSNSNNVLLATLPLEIKKVSVLTDKTLLYIDQIDTQDHGKRITVYNMQTKTIGVSIPASAGYVIDDYVLSPDKKYIAIWEVALDPTRQILQGGKSRVYAVDLSRPTVKNLLYDEMSTPTAPIHYPRAVLNDGTVFCDTFMPNDPRGGAGWAYGMSTVDFDGTNKKDIEAMRSGTYGTQPTLSPDGKYLLFSGYDGTKGDGNAVKDGYRQALLTPNTVELLNTQTLQRFRLPNIDNTNSYTSVTWDTITANVMITVLSKDVTKTGLYAYDLASKEMNKLAIPDANNAGYISQLPGGKLLIGTSDNSPSNLGNLGDHYEYALTQVSVQDGQGKTDNLSVQDTFVQYITILPANYFKAVLGTKTIAQAGNPQPTIIDMYSDKNDEKEKLQLYTFFLKPELQPTRFSQQSEPLVIPGLTLPPGITLPPLPDLNDDDVPRCVELAEQQCTQQGLTSASAQWKDCVKTNKNNNKISAKSEGLCSDSPLYLYGTSGKHVRVKIETPIYNALPASSGEYDVTLGVNGAMRINDKNYTSIAYDYQSGVRRLTPPSYGAVVAKKDVGKVLKKYAAKLGLNDKETDDLVSAGKQKATSAYAFVSFFNQEQSEQILPITFSPKPDNYLNVVFYFKLYDKKPAFTPAEPSFPAPVDRSGFTAVEVSEIVE